MISNTITARYEMRADELIAIPMEENQKCVERKMAQLIAEELIKSGKLKIKEEPNWKNNSKILTAKLTVIDEEESISMEKLRKEIMNSKIRFDNFI